VPCPLGQRGRYCNFPSGRRGSNPRHHPGKVACFRYTTAACCCVTPGRVELPSAVCETAAFPLRHGAVEATGIEPALPGCEPGVLPLDDAPISYFARHPGLEPGQPEGTRFTGGPGSPTPALPHIPSWIPQESNLHPPGFKRLLLPLSQRSVRCPPRIRTSVSRFRAGRPAAGRGSTAATAAARRVEDSNPGRFLTCHPFSRREPYLTRPTLHSMPRTPTGIRTPVFWLRTRWPATNRWERGGPGCCPRQAGVMGPG
jgi:hypothetical protein